MPDHNTASNLDRVSRVIGRPKGSHMRQLPRSSPGPHGGDSQCYSEITEAHTGLYMGGSKEGNEHI